MPNDAVIDKVRRALGRTEPLKTPPVPPAADEPITRLVHSDIGLPELFAKTAEAMKMHVDRVRPEDLVGRLADFLRANDVKRVAIPVSDLLAKLNVEVGLRSQGFEVKRWDQMTLDEVYDVDAGVTDVYSAVAETGSLVMRASEGQGRALSLVPAIHVAVVEPKNIVPDLVDLFDLVGREGAGSAISLVTGPSKTSDIEMNLVVGVHGPVMVQVFLLS